MGVRIGWKNLRCSDMGREWRADTVLLDLRLFERASAVESVQKKKCKHEPVGMGRASGRTGRRTGALIAAYNCHDSSQPEAVMTHRLSRSWRQRKPGADLHCNALQQSRLNKLENLHQAAAGEATLTKTVHHVPCNPKAHPSVSAVPTCFVSTMRQHFNSVGVGKHLRQYHCFRLGKKQCLA